MPEGGLKRGGIATWREKGELENDRVYYGVKKRVLGGDQGRRRRTCLGISRIPLLVDRRLRGKNSILRRLAREREELAGGTRSYRVKASA